MQKLQLRFTMTLLICLLLFIVAFNVYWTAGEGHPNHYNYHVRLSDAFLHGKLYLTKASPNDLSWLNELVPADNATKWYVVYPPLPAILMTPPVALLGLQFDQTLFSLVFGGLAVALAYIVAKDVTRKSDNIHSRKETTYVWCAAMFGFGTIFVWLASTGSVWLIAQVVSVFFLFLAIHEAFGKKRPFVMGLLVGASFWCRLPTILGIFFFVGLIISRQPSPSWKTRIRASMPSLLKLAAGAGIFVALDMAYNFVRFGTFFDVAYWMIPGILNEPWFSHGLFSLAYIPENLAPFLGGLPTFTATAPFIQAPMTGLAIWFTTPAFVFALKARAKDPVTWSSWAAIIAIAFVIFTKGLSGWGFGYRYAVDFYPFLFVLAVRGMGDNLRWYHKLLIVFGIVVNVWGAVAINRFPDIHVLI
jgi:hypothetical protein